MCDSWCCNHRRGPKLVCFEHRFVAKGWMPRFGTKAATERARRRTANCPTCRKPLVNIGSGAKIPAKTNTRRWKSMEAFFIADIRHQAQRPAEVDNV